MASAPIDKRRFAPRLTRVGRRVRYAHRNTRLRTGRATAGHAAAMEHELSRPLSSVASLADLLAQDWAVLPEDVRRDLAERIDDGARGIAANYGHLVVAMDLLVGTVGPGNVVPGGAAPVRDSVDAVVASLPTATDVGVSGPEAPAAIDREHLEHVLATVIGDAITYGARPVRVRIVPEAATVRIEVADHGRAIARRMRARVRSPETGRWTTLHAESRRSRALGLAVAARLVAIEGGTIWQRPMRRTHGGRILIRLNAFAAQVG